MRARPLDERWVWGIAAAALAGVWLAGSRGEDDHVPPAPVRSTLVAEMERRRTAMVEARSDGTVRLSTRVFAVGPDNADALWGTRIEVADLPWTGVFASASSILRSDRWFSGDGFFVIDLSVAASIMDERPYFGAPAPDDQWITGARLDRRITVPGHQVWASPHDHEMEALVLIPVEGEFPYRVDCLRRLHQGYVHQGHDGPPDVTASCDLRIPHPDDPWLTIWSSVRLLGDEEGPGWGSLETYPFAVLARFSRDAILCLDVTDDPSRAVEPCLTGVAGDAVRAVSVTSPPGSADPPGGR